MMTEMAESEVLEAIGQFIFHSSTAVSHQPLGNDGHALPTM
jgi:hypothetical protein